MSNIDMFLQNLGFNSESDEKAKKAAKNDFHGLKNSKFSLTLYVTSLCLSISLCLHVLSLLSLVIPFFSFDRGSICVWEAYPKELETGWMVLIKAGGLWRGPQKELKLFICI